MSVKWEGLTHTDIAQPQFNERTFWLRLLASNNDLWSLFLGRSRCVVSSCVDTVEGRVEGRGLELCLKLCVPSISGPAALPCTPGPSLTVHTHTHTHTHARINEINSQHK